MIAISKFWRNKKGDKNIYSSFEKKPYLTWEHDLNDPQSIIESYTKNGLSYQEAESVLKYFELICKGPGGNGRLSIKQVMPKSGCLLVTEGNGISKIKDSVYRPKAKFWPVGWKNWANAFVCFANALNITFLHDRLVGDLVMLCLVFLMIDLLIDTVKNRILEEKTKETKS